MWLTNGRDEPGRDGAAVPIRTILGAPAAPRRASRLVAVGARWGLWVLALFAVGVGGFGVWHLLYGDRVSGEVWIGRPPAPLATTTTSTTTSTTSTTSSTTTSTTVPPTTAAASGAGPAPAAPGDDHGSSVDAGPGSASATTPRVTTADDRGGRRGSSGSGSSGSGSSGSGSSGSGSSGSGSSGSGSGSSGRGGADDG
jgi:hypothetical protein